MNAVSILPACVSRLRFQVMLQKECCRHPVHGFFFPSGVPSECGENPSCLCGGEPLIHFDNVSGENGAEVEDESCHPPAHVGWAAIQTDWISNNDLYNLLFINNCLQILQEPFSGPDLQGKQGLGDLTVWIGHGQSHAPFPIIDCQYASRREGRIVLCDHGLCLVDACNKKNR